MSVRPQSIGLSEYEELCEARQADLIGKFSTRLLQGCWLALDQCGWPFAVVHVPEFGFKCAKESVILQPAILVVTKSLVVRTEVSASTRSEAVSGLFEYPMLEGYDRVIVNGSHGERWMLAIACG